MSAFLEVVQDDFDLEELLEDTAKATRLTVATPQGLIEALVFEGTLGPLELIEAGVPGVKDPEFERKHPRWPKGTERGGQFIEVGQRFSMGGEDYEVAHILNGKVVAHLETGNPSKAKTVVLDPAQTGGGAKPATAAAEPDEEDVVAGIGEATAKLVKGGKSASNVVAVDPYVDPKTHDPSIPIPSTSNLEPEDWKRFGKVDQENYARLQKKFGKYNSAAVKKNLDASYAKYDAAVQELVKSAYQSQFGSSSGFSLSLTSIFKGASAAAAKQLHKKRETAKKLQRENADAVQWDLYNRTRSPDVTLFHKSGAGPSWWQTEVLSGKSAAFSGLSQSFAYDANWGFGNTVVMSPVAIRHVTMSTFSAQPVPGQTYFGHSVSKDGKPHGELEISVSDQLALKPEKTLVFSGTGLNQSNPNHWKYLALSTYEPQGGQLFDTFKQVQGTSQMLPTPPSPPNIQLQGAGGKSGKQLLIDDLNVALPDAGTKITHDYKGNPTGKTLTVEQLPFSDITPEGSGGKPANDLRLKHGDFIMGQQGTKYIILNDPEDPYGMGVSYVKLVNGVPNGEAYNFEGGGVKPFYKLDGHAKIPPKKTSLEVSGFDPGQWAHAEEQKFIADFEVGEKFKVHGNAYEVTAKLPGGNAQILALDSNKTGSINGDFKTNPLVQVEFGPPKVVAAPGDILAYQGKKATVTKLLKSGQIQINTHPGVVKLDADDPALAGLHRPDDWAVEPQKTKLSQFAPHEKFQGASGQKIRPYQVVDPASLAPEESATLFGMGFDPKKHVAARNVETGELTPFPKGKSYRKLTQKSIDAEMPGSTSPPPQFSVSDEPEPSSFVYKPEEWQAGPEMLPVNQLEPGTLYLAESGTVNQILSVENDLMKVKSMDNGYVAEVPVSLAVKPVTPLVKKTTTSAGAVVPAVQGFDLSNYAEGETVTINEMPVGTVFKSPKGGLYQLKQKTAASGAVATNLLTGKPYPAIAYDKSFTTLYEKAAVEDVPYPDISAGDTVEAAKLQIGDQFTIPGSSAAVYQVTDANQPGDDGDGQGITYKAVGPNGQLGTSGWLWADQMVTLHGKSDEVTPSDLPFSDAATVDVDSLADAKIDGYKSVWGTGGKYKHHQISEMAVGTVFADKSGQTWKVKQAGANPVVTDGSVNYKADPKLRGKVIEDPALAANFKDYSPALGTTADWEKSAIEQNLTPNANLTLSALQKGDYFQDAQGDVWKVETTSGDLVSVSGPKGTNVFYADFQPPQIAMTHVYSDAPHPGLAGAQPKLPGNGEHIGFVHENGEIFGTVVGFTDSSVLVGTDEGTFSMPNHYEWSYIGVSQEASPEEGLPPLQANALGKKLGDLPVGALVQMENPEAAVWKVAGKTATGGVTLEIVKKAQNSFGTTMDVGETNAFGPNQVFASIHIPEPVSNEITPDMEDASAALGLDTPEGAAAIGELTAPSIPMGISPDTVDIGDKIQYAGKVYTVDDFSSGGKISAAGDEGWIFLDPEMQAVAKKLPGEGETVSFQIAPEPDTEPSGDPDGDPEVELATLDALKPGDKFQYSIPGEVHTVVGPSKVSTKILVAGEDGVEKAVHFKGVMAFKVTGPAKAGAPVATPEPKATTDTFDFPEFADDPNEPEPTPEPVMKLVTVAEAVMEKFDAADYEAGQNQLKVSHMDDGQVFLGKDGVFYMKLASVMKEGKNGKPIKSARLLNLSNGQEKVTPYFAISGQVYKPYYAKKGSAADPTFQPPPEEPNVDPTSSGMETEWSGVGGGMFDPGGEVPLGSLQIGDYFTGSSAPEYANSIFKVVDFFEEDGKQKTQIQLVWKDSNHPYPPSELGVGQIKTISSDDGPYTVHLFQAKPETDLPTWYPKSGEAVYFTPSGFDLPKMGTVSEVYADGTTLIHESGGPDYHLDPEMGDTLIGPMTLSPKWEVIGSPVGSAFGGDSTFQYDTLKEAQDFAKAHGGTVQANYPTLGMKKSFASYGVPGVTTSGPYNDAELPPGPTYSDALTPLSSLQPGQNFQMVKGSATTFQLIGHEDTGSLVKNLATGEEHTVPTSSTMYPEVSNAFGPGATGTPTAEGPDVPEEIAMMDAEVGTIFSVDDQSWVVTGYGGMQGTVEAQNVETEEFQDFEGSQMIVPEGKMPEPDDLFGPESDAPVPTLDDAFGPPDPDEDEAALAAAIEEEQALPSNTDGPGGKWKHEKIGNLPLGAKFMKGENEFTVAAKYGGSVLYESASGDQYSVANGHIVRLPSGMGTDAPNLSDAQIATAALAAVMEKFPSLQGIPQASVTGYASAWGSGGKYKHHQAKELKLGDRIRSKDGYEFDVIAQNGPNTIVKKAGTVTYFEVPGSMRFRKVDGEGGQPVVPTPSGSIPPGLAPEGGQAGSFEPDPKPPEVPETPPTAAPLNAPEANHYDLMDQNIKWASSLSADQKEAISHYSGSGYWQMNEWLREGKNWAAGYSENASAMLKETQRQIKNAKAALKKAKLPEPVKVYRGVNDWSNVFGTTDLESLVGGEFRDKGFISTSISSETAQGFLEGGGEVAMVMEIHVPKGANAAYLPGQGFGHNADNEKELLLNAGTKFRIVSVQLGDDYEGIPSTMRLEVIG